MGQARGGFDASGADVPQRQSWDQRGSQSFAPGFRGTSDKLNLETGLGNKGLLFAVAHRIPSLAGVHWFLSERSGDKW
jgi:hypothetical protein